jgi:hypothetical protein
MKHDVKAPRLFDHGTLDDLEAVLFIGPLIRILACHGLG